MAESSWTRAWRDTERFRHSGRFFWLCEVIGAALFAVVGTLLLPEQPSKLESALYPSLGIVSGFAVVFIAVLTWNLFRAPYRQRNEIRKRFIELEAQKKDKKTHAQVQQDIGTLIIEGTEILKGFKSVRTFDDALPIEEFKTWIGKGTDTLQRDGLDVEYPLWFRDVGINISDSVLPDYISACEAGLNRLEGILRTLGN